MPFAFDAENKAALAVAERQAAAMVTNISAATMLGLGAIISSTG